jgi:hypothetical protein
MPCPRLRANDRLIGPATAPVAIDPATGRPSDGPCPRLLRAADLPVDRCRSAGAAARLPEPLSHHRTLLRQCNVDSPTLGHRLLRLLARGVIAGRKQCIQQGTDRRRGGQSGERRPEPLWIGPVTALLQEAQSGHGGFLAY